MRSAVGGCVTEVWMVSMLELYTAKCRFGLNRGSAKVIS